MSSKVSERVASVGLILLAALIFTSVLLRYFFNWPVPDTLDFSRIFLGITVLWGIALVIVKDTHIQVDLLWTSLGNRAKYTLTIFNRILIAAFSVLFAWLVAEHVWQLIHSGKQTVDNRLPLWIFYLAVFPAGLIACYGSLVHLFEALRSRPHDQQELADD